MYKKLFKIFFLVVCLLSSCVFYPSFASARRIIAPRYTVGGTEIADLRQKYSFLSDYPTELIAHRLLALKILLNREDAGENYPELLKYSSEVLEERGRQIDAIEGLKVSYKDAPGIQKVEPMILTAYPDTIRNNLGLLLSMDSNFDQVRYSDLLYRISTFKLSNNMDFLKSAGINPSESPRVLLNATRYLKNNYFISKILGREITLSDLGLSTADFIAKLKTEIPGGEYPLFAQLPLQCEALLNSIVSILPAQQAFYEWLDKHPGKDLRERRVHARIIFERNGLNNLYPPAYSFFILSTAAEPQSNFSEALFDFINICLYNPENINKDLPGELSQRHGLDEMEEFNLFMVLDREIKSQ